MKLTGELFGCADGEVHPRIYEAGEDCPPELEEAARHFGVLDETESDAAAKAEAEAAAKAEAEAAAKAKGAAPENKAAQ
jgi:hypothetical protein